MINKLFNFVKYTGNFVKYTGNFVKYTGNFVMLFKIPYAWLLNKLGFEKSATNVLCKRPHILWTPFGNYLATFKLNLLFILFSLNKFSKSITSFHSISNV